ncbi:MAG: glycerol-3-phosphate dehydrogenase [Proteobacteria bacterium]|nr:glycerol-3-phosphate dehydrogenase [Pseudomonadota bacterium]
MNRSHRLNALQQQTPFDLLVIGGGATGCGIAVDAASRGLSVALIDKNDLAEGTSSRSTKLIHGGVRYLEMAVKKLDRAQYHLVKEGLDERGTFINNAPHLAGRVALVTPIYSWFEVPYVFSGLLLYDLMAGKKGIGHSSLICRDEALRRYPMLKADGLKAGVVYYDGQFNDSRMAVTLALTAQKNGAVIANHVEAIELLKDNGKICGARVRDTIAGDEFTVRARGVINATGPFVDRLRQLAEPDAKPLLKASTGIHIILSPRFAPPEAGLMIPKTDDGRVLFILPWQGHTLIGTTEAASDIIDHPPAKEEEIEYLLRHINRYFNLAVTRSDVSSVWSGLRPLVQAPDKANTAQLVREHLIEVGDSGLLTVAGGKWTSYRRMAEEAVDQALQTFLLGRSRACYTKRYPLVGAEHFDVHAEAGLIATYGLAADVANRLHHAYGDQAERVAELAKSGFSARLHADHPYLEAEVIYAVRSEFAERASDVVTRRLSLALLDNAAAIAVLPRVIELMSGELGWTHERCDEEMAQAMLRLTVAI